MYAKHLNIWENLQDKCHLDQFLGYWYHHPHFSQMFQHNKECGLQQPSQWLGRITASYTVTITKNKCWANKHYQLSDVLLQPNCNPLIVHIIRTILLTLKLWKPWWRQSIGSAPGRSEEGRQQVLCRAGQMVGSGPWRPPSLARTAACVLHSLPGPTRAVQPPSSWGCRTHQAAPPQSAQHGRSSQEAEEIRRVTLQE